MSVKTSGFTIVELLIVVVIIAILAAITIVSYNGMQNRSNDTVVQSDLRSLAKKFELYKIDNAAATYPYGGALGTSTNTVINVPISKNAYKVEGNTYNVLNCTSASTPGSNFAILAQSKSGKYFSIDSVSNKIQEVTASVTLVDGSSCPTLLPGSAANGTGFSGNAWRPWTS